MIKAVIFDFNGVITDSLKLDHEIFLKECENDGQSPPKDTGFYTSLFNGNVYENLNRLGYVINDNGRIYKEFYLKNMQKAPMFSGMRQVIESLKKKYLMGIVSSNFEVILNKFMEVNRMENVFDMILTADTHTRKEEKIRMFLDRFSLSNKEVVFIGDTIMDVLACKSTGTRVIAVTWGYHSEKELAKESPDYFARRPEDILKILEEL